MGTADASVARSTSQESQVRRSISVSVAPLKLPTFDWEEPLSETVWWLPVPVGNVVEITMDLAAQVDWAGMVAEIRPEFCQVVLSTGKEARRVTTRWQVAMAAAGAQARAVRVDRVIQAVNVARRPREAVVPRDLVEPADRQSAPRVVPVVMATTAVAVVGQTHLQLRRMNPVVVAAVARRTRMPFTSPVPDCSISAGSTLHRPEQSYSPTRRRQCQCPRNRREGKPVWCWERNRL